MVKIQRNAKSSQTTADKEKKSLKAPNRVYVVWRSVCNANKVTTIDGFGYMSVFRRQSPLGGGNPNRKWA